MKLTIQKRIGALGGKCAFKPTSLQANIESIEFEVPLIIQDFYSFCDTLEEFKKTHIDLFKNQQALFFKQTVQYFYSDQNTCYTNVQFQKELFTPFQEGTSDYAE